MIKIDKNLLSNDAPTESLVSIFTVGINSKHCPGLYTPYKKPTPKFTATSNDG